MKANEALKAVLGGAQLERTQIQAVFDSLFAGEQDPVALGGLLVALAGRGETREELIGAVQSMRGAMVPFEHDAPDAIDTCGTGGSGLDTFNVSTCSAIVAAAAGARVIKHGNRSASSKCGSADLLEHLGLPLELSPEQARVVFEEAGLTFLFAPVYHPAMRHAGPVRRSLGVRTVFNLLGPLCNPGGVKHQVVGVFDPERLSDVTFVLEELGAKRALVVHGSEGADELTLQGENQVRTVGCADSGSWNAADLGLQSQPIASCSGGDATANASLLHSVLSGELSSARELVLLNAAAALVVSEQAATSTEGLFLAREAIDGGAAARKLAQWIRVAQGVAR